MKVVEDGAWKCAVSVFLKEIYCPREAESLETVDKYPKI